MSEKIITCKDGKVVEKEGKNWVELIDQDGKTHRVFRSQWNENEQIDLSKEVAMLKEKIESGAINGLTLKLTKVQKGNFYNVVGVELVKDIFVQQAAERVGDNIDKRCSIIQASNIAITILQANCPFKIETITPKQTTAIANVIKAIAAGLDTHFTSSSKIVEEIKENIEGG